MKKSIHVAILAGATMSIVTTASAQTVPQPVAPTTPSLMDQARQNIGTAQLMFQLGQAQGELYTAQQKDASRDKQEAELANWWKGYVEGIDHMVEAGIVRQPTGELMALPESERHKNVSATPHQ